MRLLVLLREGDKLLQVLIDRRAQCGFGADGTAETRLRAGLVTQKQGNIAGISIHRWGWRCRAVAERPICIARADPERRANGVGGDVIIYIARGG